MRKAIRFVGLDVHAQTISVAVAEQDGEVRSLGTITNRPEALLKLLKKLGPAEQLRVCYEAGPTGYVLYWELTGRGIECEVIAPSLIPVRAGDRVKTDRRDACKLARAHRAGELTPVWVPDEAHEALRDLVRAREAAIEDQLRARNRLGKFLLRQGRRPLPGTRSWTLAYMSWLKSVRFAQPAQEATMTDYLAEVEHAGDRIQRLERAIEAVETIAPSTRAVIEALQALRGVARLTAVTIVSEVGRLSRFPHPRQLMGYSGMVSSEYSSGGRVRRGAITKSGNAHLRRVLVEAAWSYCHRPAVGSAMRKRQLGLTEEVKAMAWKAQHRLHRRYFRLVAKGKSAQQSATAIARELLGFIWAIGVHAERSSTMPSRPLTVQQAAAGNSNRPANRRDLVIRLSRTQRPHHQQERSVSVPGAIGTA
jgi:transposase